MAIIKQTKRGVDTSNRIPKLGGKLSGFGRDTGLSAISKATVRIHEAFMGSDSGLNHYAVLTAFLD
jgi:hypothetical protein